MGVTPILASLQIYSLSLNCKAHKKRGSISPSIQGSADPIRRSRRQVWNRWNQLDLFTTIPGWITLAMSTQVNFAVFRRAVKLSQSWSSVSCCGITEVGDFFFWPICLKPPLTGWLGNILCEEFLEDVAFFLKWKPGQGRGGILTTLNIQD